jgi:RNA polymerase sigma-70 factor (family 1)
MGMVGYEKFTDDFLIHTLKAGNKKAFEELYEKYGAALYSYIFQRVRIKEISEEIVQDIFVSLWEKRESLQITSLSAYLFAAAKYKIISHIRSSAVREVYIESFGAFLAAKFDQSTEEFINLSDLQSLIERNLEKLPGQCQRVFRLSRMDHISNQEIAQMLGISVRTVENYITQALKHLRSILDFTSKTL